MFLAKLYQTLCNTITSCFWSTLQRQLTVSKSKERDENKQMYKDRKVLEVNE